MRDTRAPALTYTVKHAHTTCAYTNSIDGVLRTHAQIYKRARHSPGVAFPAFDEAFDLAFETGVGVEAGEAEARDAEPENIEDIIEEDGPDFHSFVVVGSRSSEVGSGISGTDLEAPRGIPPPTEYFVESTGETRDEEA